MIIIEVQKMSYPKKQWLNSKNTKLSGGIAVLSGLFIIPNLAKG